MDILVDFPNLIPQNIGRTHYQGFIEIKGQSYYLDIQLPSLSNHGDQEKAVTNNDLKEATLSCEWKLKDLLRDYHQLLIQRLKQSSRLVDFLHEFKRIVELQLEGRCHTETTTINADLYRRLVAELQDIGWHRLVFIDSSFTKLHLITEDVRHRKHVLRIQLNHTYPAISPRCTSDLPKAFNFSWTPQNTVKNILDQFHDNLDQYQDLWHNLDEIDQKTWVLEPENPTTADLYRRIALGNNASVQVTVDVNHPRMFPECRFLGADHVINPLKTKLNAHVSRWNSEKLVLENLTELLEIEFPSPSETNKQDFSMDCAICYTYRLEEEIPDLACDNPQCGQPFHHTCLYEWLRSLPSFRQSFNMAFGECPFCNTPITVKTR